MGLRTRYQRVLLYTLGGLPSALSPQPLWQGLPISPSTAIESQVPFRSFVNMHPLAYQCNLVLGMSLSGTSVHQPQERLTPGGRIGFITFLNTFAIGVGSLEIIQFVVDRSSDATFSNRSAQGVESTQLVLTLAGSVCGFWL